MPKTHPLNFRLYTAVADHLYAVSGDLLEIAYEIHRDAPFVNAPGADTEADLAYGDEFVAQGNAAFDGACRFGWQEAMDYALPTRRMTDERAAQIAAA